MGFQPITTGQFTDLATGLTAECVCLPLKNKQKNSIEIKDGKIFVNYEKIYLDVNGNEKFVEEYSYQVTEDERLTAWDQDVLPNGSTTGGAIRAAIVDRIKEEQGIL